MNARFVKFELVTVIVKKLKKKPFVAVQCLPYMFPGRFFLSMLNTDTR